MISLRRSAFVLTLALSASTGCATLMGGQRTIAYDVTTLPAGGKVKVVTALGERVSEPVFSPAKIVFDLASSHMIQCEKEGYKPGYVIPPREVSPWFIVSVAFFWLIVPPVVDLLAGTTDIPLDRKTSIVCNMAPQ